MKIPKRAADSLHLATDKRARLTAEGEDGNVARGRFPAGLPTDVLPNILSNLDTAGLGTAAVVAKGWSAAKEEWAHGSIVASAYTDGVLKGRRASKKTWIYDTKDDVWKVLPVRAPLVAEHVQMIRAGNGAYFVGKENGDRGLARFDPYTKDWSLRSVDEKHWQHVREYGTAGLGGVLYAAARSRSGVDSSVQAIDLTSAEGLTFTNYAEGMNVDAFSRVTSIAHRGHIYMVGGVEDSDNEEGVAAQTTTVRWSPGEDQAEVLANMNVGRWDEKLVSVGDYLYAFGGLSSTGYLSNEFTAEQTVERYCPSSNTWKIITSMPTARVDFAVAVVKTRIFVMGGTAHSGKEHYDQGEPTDLVEIYDTATGQWTEGAPMPRAAKLDACASFAMFDYERFAKAESREEGQVEEGPQPEPEYEPESEEESDGEWEWEEDDDWEEDEGEGEVMEVEH